MWEPTGTKIDNAKLSSLCPHIILYEYEEPLIFIANGLDCELLLVYSLNAFNRTSRYLVSEINSDILANLRNGHIDILSALQQPKCWIIDLGEYANVKSLWCVEFASIPKELLPKPGVMLEPTDEADGDSLICKGCDRDQATRRWQHCGSWMCLCDLCQDAADEYWHDLWRESQMP